MNPAEVGCPACGAHAGEPCTAPTTTNLNGRRAVTWHHYARIALAEGWT